MKDPPGGLLACLNNPSLSSRTQLASHAGLFQRESCSFPLNNGVGIGGHRVLELGGSGLR